LIAQRFFLSRVYEPPRFKKPPALLQKNYWPTNVLRDHRASSRNIRASVVFYAA